MDNKLEELRNVIKQWNANRLDLFEISQPNKDLEFHGVMRFYFQDAGQKVATKCIRVSSTASTNDVIEILIEKFRPDIRMLTFAEYALYEIHESGEERKLEKIEKPLVVQLNWNKDDREGRFLLRRMNEKTMLPAFETKGGKSSLNGKSSDDLTFKRKLSKREKKEKKKKEKEGKIKNDDDEKSGSKEKLAEKLYNELPETSFTRSISNPEAVMRRRRQQKLEKKLQQFVNEGGSDAGGTLRIFGETLNKDVPYKTLLLSTKENSLFVIKEILEKYGLDKENPSDYCLVQLIIPPNLANLDKDLDISLIQNLSENIKEYILDDDDCPLVLEKLHNKNLGILTFHIRKKPDNYQPKKRKKNYLLGPSFGNDDNDENSTYPYFIEVNPLEGKPPKKIVLFQAVTEVGCSNAPSSNIRNKNNPISNDRQYLHLVGGNVQPKHCIITFLDGIVTVTPQMNEDCESETFVNNLKITDSYILKHGMVVRFGKIHAFNFVDPTFKLNQKKLSPDILSQMQNSKLNSINNGILNQEPEHNNQNIENNESIDQLSTYSKASKKSEEQQINNSSLNNNQQLQNFNNSESQLKKGEAILPAVLELWEETEDLFLNCIINNLEVNQVQFKLAPTYTLYMAVRYRASTHFKPSATVEERAVRLTMFTNKFCQMINYVIRINYRDPSLLAFWLANSSELLHFIKQDRHLSAFTVDGQELLAESVQAAFKQLVTCLEFDLENSMVNLLSENEQDATIAINKMLTVLNGAMALLRNCCVNAALTIQMFSQIFHYINMHLFNQLVGINQNENLSTINVNYCSEIWGNLIKHRLIQIINWAKKQGIELAADCYLNTIFQASTLLQLIKSQNLENLGQLIKTQCYKLNSLQLRCLLEQFERNPNSNQQQLIPQSLIEQLVEVAQQTSDKLAAEYGREIRLAEEPDLHLAFLLPEDGYFCDAVKGVPQGLQEFILPLVLRKLCNIAIQPTSAGRWTIYLTTTNLNNTSINSTSNSSNNGQNINNTNYTDNFAKPILNKPLVMHNVPSNPNVNNQEPPTEPTSPTVMNNWQASQQQPHFMIPNSNTRTLPTNPMSHIQAPSIPSNNFITHPQQQIYGTQVQFSGQLQQNNLLSQQHPSIIQQSNQQKPEITTIKLKKGNHGMGLSIVAARGSAQEQLGIYIKSVVQGGAADMDGRLKAGDQLLKVDGNSLIGISQEKAAELMTQTGAIVTLEVAKSAANFNGLAAILQPNSPRIPLNKNNINNRIIHSSNLLPKSQTTEHLKQHSASLVNLHPYSTYPYPQQNIQQQEFHQQQLLMQQQQQQLLLQQQQQLLLQQQQLVGTARSNPQIFMQSQMTPQQLAQKRLSTTLNDDRTYQNISFNQQQQRINASQTALFNSSAEHQQLLQQQHLNNVLNSRPISTMLPNRDPDQMYLNYSMSHSNLASNNLRAQPQHYSSVSQLAGISSSSTMPSWATLPHGGYQQQQQLLNQQKNNLVQQQQQLYLRNQQQRQEEKLKSLKLEQEQFQNYNKSDQNFNEDNFEETSIHSDQHRQLKKVEDLEKNKLKRPDWQQQQRQKAQIEEQEERLRKLKFEETKLEEQLQVAQEVEEHLIREAKKRKEDIVKPSQFSHNSDTDNSEEGISLQQQQRLERLLSRNYQNNVSSNGIVTVPNSSSTNEMFNQQNSLSSSSQRVPSLSNVQSTTSTQSQISKSALRNPSKQLDNDQNQNGDVNGQLVSLTNSQPTVKKVSWNEQIVNNAIIIDNDDEDLEDEENYVENDENSKIENYKENGLDEVNNYADDDFSLNKQDKIENSFTLQDIDEVLGAPTDSDFSNNPNQPNNTPNVIGAQEVYRDPRERIKAEKLKQNVNNTWTNEVPEKLSFKEKMKMFATRVEN